VWTRYLVFTLRREEVQQLSSREHYVVCTVYDTYHHMILFLWINTVLVMENIKATELYLV